jgi:hypothetical protein
LPIENYNIPVKFDRQSHSCNFYAVLSKIAKTLLFAAMPGCTTAGFLEFCFPHWQQCFHLGGSADGFSATVDCTCTGSLL